MSELLKVFIISFISDLDNIVIYLTIMKRYSSALWVLLILPGVLALNRTFYVSVVHTVYEQPGVELLIGLILLIIAVKLAVQRHDVNSVRSSSAGRALFYIIAIDFLLCIDGVLIISYVSENHIIIFAGFLISLLVLLLFSRAVLKILQYFPLFYVIAASFIGYIAMENITRDQLLYHWLLSFNETFPSIDIIPMFSKVTAVLIVCVGLLNSMKNTRIYKVR